ncbi:MAG: hypothetical protein JW984_04605 [Deltaproteobacteria bacterium]|uniref:Uncharacterized protein n=1 Tax=Candidatus Zymogenus saltonus TaxID=2844893 RepID=A0A9D8KDY1_9DELT|nr:hypothetical protein [Candidatus Zymogenus saltonus]
MKDSMRLGAFLSLIVAILLMVLLRVYMGSAAEYKRANEALKSGDKVSAINHYGRSIKWYAPLSPWVKRSIEELWEIGEGSYAYDTEEAVYAVSILRSSLYAARGPFTPFKSRIEEADGWLSLHLSEGEGGPDREDVEFVLGSKARPNRLWSLAVGVGFVGWTLSVFAFIFFVFPETEAGVNQKRAVVLGLVTCVFYSLWMCGLYFA